MSINKRRVSNTTEVRKQFMEKDIDKKDDKRDIDKGY